MPIIIWIAKSLLILGIFHFGVPTIVNAVTRNSWAKLPAMLFCGFGAGAFMAWLRYVPAATVLFLFSLIACFGAGDTTGMGNLWLKPTTGYWEEPYWSLGVNT